MGVSPGRSSRYSERSVHRLIGGGTMALDTVKMPSLEQLRDVAAELGFNLTDADLLAHRESLLPSFEAYNLLDRMPDELPPVTYPRLPGRRPAPEENRHGAWYVKTEIEGATSGKLKGKKIALKDNICLAGVPMMNGASTMEGYVPDVDATVATRILDAGGTIAGKTVCEYFCFSGGSHTSATGPVHNPHRMGYSAGGVAKPYREALGKGAAGLKIAVLEEGFSHPQSMAQVDSIVREAAQRFKGLGTTVEAASIPMHRLG